jgi:hypothetical protein
MNGIMFFRLSNGEDIVASVVFKDDNDLILHEPLKVVYLPKGKGLLSISFMQWVFSKITHNQEFLINMKDIITMSVPSNSLTEHYKETVQYFQKTDLVHLNKTGRKTDEEAMDQMFDEMEEELELDEGETAEEVIRFLNSILSSNNKGTLH